MIRSVKEKKISISQELYNKFIIIIYQILVELMKSDITGQKKHKPISQHSFVIHLVPFHSFFTSDYIQGKEKHIT